MYEIIFHLKQKTMKVKFIAHFLFLQAERCGSKFYVWSCGEHGHPPDQTPGGLPPQDPLAYIWHCSAYC